MRPMPLVLTYFNGRGVIEVARYMLHIGGADWEDFRYPIDMQSKAKYEHAAEDKVGFGRNHNFLVFCRRCKISLDSAVAAFSHESHRVGCSVLVFSL